jgi:anti-anti-sigma factor
MPTAERMQGDATVVSCAGRYAADAELEEFDHRLAKAVDRVGSRVILDLAGLEFVTSRWFGVLAGQVKRARAGGGDIKLCALDRRMKALFAIPWMLVIETYDSVAEALQAFHPSNPGGRER